MKKLKLYILFVLLHLFAMEGLYHLWIPTNKLWYWDSSISYIHVRSEGVIILFCILSVIFFYFGISILKWINKRRKLSKFLSLVFLCFSALTLFLSGQNIKLRVNGPWEASERFNLIPIHKVIYFNKEEREQEYAEKVNAFTEDIKYSDNLFLRTYTQLDKNGIVINGFGVLKLKHNTYNPVKPPLK